MRLILKNDNIIINTFDLLFIEISLIPLLEACLFQPPMLLECQEGECFSLYYFKK